MVGYYVRKPKARNPYYAVSPSFGGFTPFSFPADDKIRNGIRRHTQPAANILEAEDHYTIEIAAPGVKKEAFELHVAKDVLTVKVEVDKPEVEGWKRREFDFTNFQRSFRLNEEIDASAITANYESGILRITLPKGKTAMNRRINIQ